MTQQNSFPVSVILEKRPSVSKWANAYWTVLGIIVGESTDEGMMLLHSQNDIEQYRYSGLSVTLYRDECESYYHNLMSPKPGCYVITDKETDEAPVPFKVSMSFDEAHSYQEGGKEIYAVEIPNELYQWVEAYVLDNYFPEKKRKRKLNDWKKGGGNIRV
jgi:hypothetical protein